MVHRWIIGEEMIDQPCKVASRKSQIIECLVNLNAIGAKGIVIIRLHKGMLLVLYKLRGCKAGSRASSRLIRPNSQ